MWLPLLKDARQGLFFNTNGRIEYGQGSTVKIQSKPSTPAYREGWERVFGRKITFKFPKELKEPAVFDQPEKTVTEKRKVMIVYQNKI